MGNSVKTDYYFGGGVNDRSDDIVVRIGQVISVDDEYHGSRIKVRIDQDSKEDETDIAYAFPLLPKTLHTIPKVGEAVLIFLSKLSNKDSIRYYIGPLISQPQYFYNEQYFGGKGTSNSLLKGSLTKPLTSIDKDSATHGSFPKESDIALVGRKSEDIILKDGEIDIRCGIRGQGEKLGDDDFLKGDVIFNTHSPSYLQLKYKRGLCKGNKQVADSVINLVADKINLISHKDVNHFNLTDNEELIKSDELDDIMQKLHQVPYGDLLIKFLDKMRIALINHTHAYLGLPTVFDVNVFDVANTNLEEILSENVRIS